MMLRSWKIRNFKSFKGIASVTFAPITVFVGANSSGKSTIIQSILLVKQTCQYASSTRALALNGPILKLGGFSDVRHFFSTDPSISFEWELADSLPRSGLAALAYRAGGAGAGLGPQRRDNRTGTIKCKLDYNRGEPSKGQISGSRPIATSDEYADLNPILSKCSFSQSRVVEGQEFEPLTVNLTLKDADLDEPDLYPDLSAFRDGGVNVYEVTAVDKHTEVELRQWANLSVAPEIKGATLQHCFPSQLILRYNAGTDRAQKIVDSLFLADSTESRVRPENSRLRVPPDIFTLILSYYSVLRSLVTQSKGRGKIPFDYLLQYNPMEGIDESSSLSDISNRLSSYRSFAKQLLEVDLPSNQELTDLQEKIKSRVSSWQGSESRTIRSISPNLQAITGRVKDYFSDSIRYLGPLRDEPRAFYQLDALGTAANVGYRGEFTAPVLNLYRDVSVSYYPSSMVEVLESGVPSVESPLYEAVTDWLSYLGIAEGVETSERGILGHTIKINVDRSEKYSDLINVGVGASQVLPIVVMALVAPTASTLIFEQPELHLHPKVQARLADFFLAISFLGKQCILETHSEYMIERFRRRIAESETEKVINQLQIYFTEKYGTETKCRPIPVTPYGAIRDWPKDFFDQSQIETSEILRAAARKRQRIRDMNVGEF